MVASMAWSASGPESSIDGVEGCTPSRGHALISARRRQHGRIHEGSNRRGRQGHHRGGRRRRDRGAAGRGQEIDADGPGLPEEVADAAIASDGDSFKDSATPTSMFYSLKVNDDAKPEWKDHYLAYTKGAKASKGHINVSHSYNEETKEIICVERRLRRGCDGAIAIRPDDRLARALRRVLMLGCGVSIIEASSRVCDAAGNGLVEGVADLAAGEDDAARPATRP